MIAVMYKLGGDAGLQITFYGGNGNGIIFAYNSLL